MKARKAIFWLMLLLPAVICLIALPFLPERIPAHYNLAGVVDRWGSKYETLIFPGMNFLFGAIMSAVKKYAAKEEKQGENNEKAVELVAIVGLAVFDAMHIYFIAADFRQAELLSDSSVDLYSLLFGVLSLGLIVLGNFMPKLKMNSLAGVRTPSSMKNEDTWQRSQRFGGIALMAAGALGLAVCIFTKGIICMVACLALLIASAAMSAFFAAHVSKEEK